MLSHCLLASSSFGGFCGDKPAAESGPTGCVCPVVARSPADREVRGSNPTLA